MYQGKDFKDRKNITDIGSGTREGAALIFLGVGTEEEVEDKSAGGKIGDKCEPGGVVGEEGEEGEIDGEEYCGREEA